MKNIPVNYFSLRFDSEMLEADFVKSSAEQTLVLIRTSLLLACFLYAIFGILDRWMVPEQVEQIRLIRFGVCLLLVLVYSLTFLAFFKKYTQVLLFTVALILGLGIVGMILIADQQGGIFYYAGLILVIMYVHGLLRIRFVYASAATVIIIASYEGIAIGLKGTPTTILINNTFFLISANIIGMFVSYALEYYMRNVFWQNQILASQQKQLEIEDARKAKELHDARQLHLSLLPQCINEFPDLDICFTMQTATEVGGDYYDYIRTDDGTWTIAIGDATGHGMKAGIMVCLVKSLFITYGAMEDIPSFFCKCSQTIRQLKLKNLFMSLLLVKIKVRKMKVSSAGMPPILVYRSGQNVVEEMVIQGMPLGGPAFSNYQTIETILYPGDTVLLMTDGFAELFNDKGETLDHPRIKDAFQSVGSNGVEQIIEHLRRVGQEWSHGKPQDDDITFVLFKVKQTKEKERSPVLQHHVEDP